MQFLQPMRCFIVALCICLFSFPVWSQDRVIDSLQALVSGEKNDSVRSVLLTKLALEQYGYDPEQGNQTLGKSFASARKGNYAFPLGFAYQALSDFAYQQGDFQRSLGLNDSAVYFLKKASLNPAQKEEAWFWEINAIASIGTTLAAMEKQSEAIEQNLKAISLWKQTRHPDRFEKIGTAYANIASFAVDLRDYRKALDYDRQALDAYIQSGNQESISYAAIFVASDYGHFAQPDSAQPFFALAEPYVLTVNKPALNIEYYSKLGMNYQAMKRYDEGIRSLRKALKNAWIMHDPVQVINIEKGLATNYLGKGRLDSAEAAGTRALKQALLTRQPHQEMTVSKVLADISYARGKTQQAYAYLQRFNKLKDSLQIAEGRNEVRRAEVKYATLEKENRIQQLEQEKKIQDLIANRRKLVSLFSVLGMLALLLILLLSRRNHRQKENMQQRRIAELETEKKLAATESVLKGEEQERARLAKDLHDGLSGMLSGVKYTLQDMKGNLIMTPQNQQAFERSIDMLDSSIREMRRVAHNMMPEVLVRYGLDAALKDYAADINRTGILRLVYQSMGDEAIAGMEQSQALSIYRIVQELINNVIKHASATEALVQLLAENGRLVVNVEDNGRGFDPVLTQGSGGLGWSNIRSRVELMKGHLDIDTAPGKGTSVSMDFKLT